LKLSFSTLGCPDWPLDIVVERASRYGYDAVDFRGLDGQMGVYILPEFTDDAARTAGMIRDAGLEISAFSSGAKMFHLTARDEARSCAEVREYARLCERFGVEFIRVFGGATGGTDPGEAVDRAAASLRKLADQAAPATLVVETHDDWVDSALLAGVLDRAGATNVAALWDLHHPWRHGESPEQTYANIGNRTRYTHVKDGVVSGNGKSRCVLPGKGDVPLAEMISLLAEGGYDGYLTVEWEKMWQPEIAGPDEAMPAYAAYLRSLGA